MADPATALFQHLQAFKNDILVRLSKLVRFSRFEVIFVPVILLNAWVNQPILGKKFFLFDDQLK